jgi:tRNA A-37 threonylcarbamoyl transferase component Bud32
MASAQTQLHDASAAAPSRCRVARGREMSRFESELARLLHKRLFLATSLALVPALLFFLRDLVQPQEQLLQGSFDTLLRGVLTLIEVGLLVVLWRWSDWSLCQLRRLEIALVSILVFFFALLQWSMFWNHPLFQLADNDTAGLQVVRLWIDSSAVRWFFLIVIYGVLIPNTWQRCLLVTGSIALVPLVLILVGAWYFEKLSSDLAYGLLDLVILLGTGMLVAVFGSYRIGVLQQQAFQAQQLGQYRLKRRIGSGGMGEVFEAEHVLLRRRCAIKLIRPEQTQDRAVLERFEREVQAMAGLNHPNNVEVFDFGQSEDGTFYYVMEYLEGLTLEELVKRFGPLPPARVIYLLRQVCRALREAHGIGLLHRDIKPSNIIVCTQGGEFDVVKLLDFGLVQSLSAELDSRLTLKGMVLGSPPFMSPEQAAGRNDLTPATDIYAVGGVGYFLVTGHPPFERETAMELMLAHAYEPVPLPSSYIPTLPEDLQQVILRCLAKKPSERYAQVSELEAALLQCSEAGRWSEEQAQRWWREQGQPAVAAISHSTAEVIHATIALR